MFKQKYHKKWAKFLDSEYSWRDLMFFLSTFCLELHLITIWHLYMYITTLHVGLFLPRLSLQDSVSLDVFSKESCILSFIYDTSIFLPSIFIVFAFQSFFSHFAFRVCLLHGDLCKSSECVAMNCFTLIQYNFVEFMSSPLVAPLLVQQGITSHWPMISYCRRRKNNL